MFQLIGTGFLVGFIQILPPDSFLSADFSSRTNVDACVGKRQLSTGGKVKLPFPGTFLYQEGSCMV